MKIMQTYPVSKVELAERLRQVRPRTREQLQSYVQAYLGLRIPSKRICRAHDSPLDYLTYAVLGEEFTVHSSRFTAREEKTAGGKI